MKLSLETFSTEADGVAVQMIGQLPFSLVKGVVEAPIQVSRHELYESCQTIERHTGVFPELAGAVGLAGCLKYLSSANQPSQLCAVVVSGRNIDGDRVTKIRQNL